MIKGLDKFKERFAGFEDQYVLIGGTANVLALDAAGITARQTKDLDKVCAEADILIAALGSPEFIKAHMVKEGAVVIDVGTTRVSAPETKSGFRLKGDVKFDEVAPKCSYITPVPGGVGPMTRVSLLQNTLMAAKRN